MRLGGVFVGRVSGSQRLHVFLSCCPLSDFRLPCFVLSSMCRFMKVPAEYPLRPSLISLTEDKKPDADAAGDAALREELCTVAKEVRVLIDFVRG